MVIQVVRLGFLPDTPGMLLVEEGGDVEFGDSSGWTFLMNIDELAKANHDERYLQLKDEAFFATGMGPFDNDIFQWGNGLLLDPILDVYPYKELMPYEDVPYAWDRAYPIIGGGCDWERQRYRSRTRRCCPVYRFGMLTDWKDGFLCEFDWSLYRGKRGTYRIRTERLGFCELLRPEILIQAHIDLAGYIFWPYNFFMDGFALSYLWEQEEDEAVWAKAYNIVYPAEDKEKPKWKALNENA